ncbi:toxin-antitoxin system YwqK family antitoxin [Pseudomonas ovata]|uniref:toxin-antitoxin system YwqK family antitoxin n=1 Tax=Pseudomonas ovata TaxID=1839709 RepID=UPI000D695C97|nr:toxin-antitoxin system YwqK family antitoxin [Pseudomonas ovata]
MDNVVKVDLKRAESHLRTALLDGRLEGPAHITETGRPQAALTYRNGQLDGPMVLYHSNGVVSARLHYRLDKLHGPAQFYSPQGPLIREANYQAGLLHGVTNTYFEDGSLAAREHFRLGQMHGISQRFHSNGNVAARMEYERGKLLQRACEFSRDGRPLDAYGRPLRRWKAWWVKWQQGPQ